MIPPNMSPVVRHAARQPCGARKILKKWELRLRACQAGDGDNDFDCHQRAGERMTKVPL